MNRKSAIRKSASVMYKNSVRLVSAWLFVACTVSGCGGGGGISIAGDNQGTDPATIDYPIAYVRRQLPTQPVPQNQQNNLQDPFAFHPGGRLLIRARADGDAREENITDRLFPDETELYDVKDLTISPDGKLLAFALRAPLLENAQPIDQPSWDIYVYDFQTKQIKAVISSKNRAEGNDVAPQFLDDGRIVFVSDRQARSRELLASTGSPAYSGVEESRQRKAGVLHIMDGDGTDIKQISFNQSHDLAPSLLRNGKLVFTRWDQMAGNNGMNLYTVNPSGMGLSGLYGYHSHATGSDPATQVQFSQPREMEDGRLVTVLRPYRSASMGGDLVAIDINHFSDNDQPIWEHLNVTGTAQQSLAANPIYTGNLATQLSPGGQFGAAWPLFDGTNRMLISWSQCRALDPTDQRIIPCINAPIDALPAPLLYGVWIFDPQANTQKPIVTPQEGVIFTDIVAASPAKTIARLTEPFAGNGNDLLDYGNNILTNLEQPGNELAVLDIRSVYNLDGHASASIINQSDPSNPAYQQYRARFLQIVQAVPIPANNEEINDTDFAVPGFAFGVSSAQLMRQIIGYVPIEPDGSVVVQVPADVPITFNILDANAQSISPRHRVWWQFRAGEVVRCIGCHDTSTPANAKLPHGRFDSLVADINPGTDSSLAFPIGNPTLLTMRGNRSGQTLAEIYAANKQQPRKPSLNVYFSDEWAVNPAQRKAVIDARYVNDDPANRDQVPVNPVTSDACLQHWNARCRIVINYDKHIQPIWSLKSRPVFDSMNVFISDNRCISCHAPANSLGAAQVPAGQLDLSNTQSSDNANVKTSYQELFRGDTQRDITGAPIPDTPPLDADGNPRFKTIGAVMSAGSARNSSRFFGCFNSGTCGNLGETPTVDHSGMLTPAELRLLSEWLDNGAQYYNDVVKAVQAAQ